MLSDLPLAMLVNHLWQSTLFMAAIWSLAFLLRRNSARVRYALWLAASLKFLLPFALLAALGTQIPWQKPAPDAGDATIVVDVAARFAAPMTGDLTYRVARPQSRPDLERLKSLDRLRRLDVTAFFSALGLWFFGALFVAIRWMVRWIDIHRALRRSTVMTNIEFPAPVRATEQKLEPGVMGIFRPKLLLPAGIETRLTPDQLRAVLAHEQCHLRWHDNFTASLHMLVETVFWFFPPVWWIGARLIEERERACDEQVVRDGHSPESYAEGILNVCEHYVASRLPCVSGVSGSDLRKRIENIVKRTIGAKLDGRKKLVLAATACCAVAAPIAAGMISGNTTQVLFSLDRSTLALLQYWRVAGARLQAAKPAMVGTGRAVRSCPDPDPGAAVIQQQRTLAALAAKLPTSNDKALLYAITANDRSEVRRLLSAGAPRNGDGSMWPDSLMHIAAEFADVQMLELLATSGFSIDERSVRGGSDPTMGRNPTGRTPMMTAISAGRLNNARWFIEHGANVHVVDGNGSSALLLAMVHCNDEGMVSLLLQAGARPDLVGLWFARATGVDLSTGPSMPAPPAKNWRPPAFDAQISGDLDGDDKPDQAVVLLSSDGTTEGLFVLLSRHPDRWTTPVVTQTTQAHIYTRLEMSLIEPRRGATGCSNSYTGQFCKVGEPAAFALKRPGIRLSQPGSPSSVVYWDDDAQELKRHWIDD